MATSLRRRAGPGAPWPGRSRLPDPYRRTRRGRGTVRRALVVAVGLVLAVAAVVLQFCGAGIVGEGDDRGGEAPPIDAADLVATDPVGRDDLTADQQAQLDQFTAQATAALEGFWVTAYPAAYGGEYRPVNDAAPTFPSRGPITCETPVSVAHNALYCAGGDYITWDGEELFPNLATNFGLGAIAAVLAHEWGHAIQSPSRHGFQGAPITAELQADCFAGAWFGWVVSGGAGLSLDTGDVDGAIAALLLLRDSPGAAYGDPRADGSAFDRAGAFQDGVDGGAAGCVGYEADGVPLVDVPIATGAADERSLAGAVESVTDHLPVFFADQVALGQELYDPSRDQPNPCPEPAPGPVSYCERTGTVVGDAAQLRHLHDRIGDFSAALLFAAEWGRAVAIERGVAEEAGIDLMGECLAGAWAGEVTAADPTETGVVVAPGDLDEALATLLRFGRTSTVAGAVERLDRVQQGFLEGREACLEQV